MPSGRHAAGLTGIAGAMDVASGHLSAGRTREAEAILRQIAAAVPDHHDALNNLGCLAFQAGLFAEAGQWLVRAVATGGATADTRWNLGLALSAQGRTAEAAAAMCSSLEAGPVPGRWLHLADMLYRAGLFEQALEAYSAAAPPAATGFASLAHPASPAAAAHLGVGRCLARLGQPGVALFSLRRAAALAPDEPACWAEIGNAIIQARVVDHSPGLEADILALLDRRVFRPNLLSSSIIRILKANPGIGALLREHARDGVQPGTAQAIAASLSNVPLLLRLMSLAVVVDLDFERFLTALRRALLVEVATQNRLLGEAAQRFCVALALNCDLNGHVFATDGEEDGLVAGLSATVVDQAAAGECPDPSALLLLAAYRCLDGLGLEPRLCEAPRLAALRPVLERQILHPVAERATARTLPVLTPISDGVSAAVRGQYEDHPYPVWAETKVEEPLSVRALLARDLPHVRLDGEWDGLKPRILVAGCGTGQHAALAAMTFRESQVLAIDLSLCSLAYAKRQTDAIGLGNITYAQADILELGHSPDITAASFDIVDCVGVLHHLGDPLGGWRRLVDLLRPAGLMRVGLYSRLGRMPLEPARELIRRGGYGTSTEEIRRFRRDVIAHPDRALAKTLERYIDFHSIQGCRDLLFHVQEHRFSIGEIAAALDALELEFLGFVTDRPSLAEFRARHPDEASLGDLRLWDGFETARPETFANMYQFWARRPG